MDLRAHVNSRKDTRVGLFGAVAFRPEPPNDEPAVTDQQ
jgi:hypothetical protein